MVGVGIWGVVLAAGLAATRPAEACGALPEPWYTVDKQTPLGEGVLLDAPIVVELKETQVNTTEATIADFQLQLQVVGADVSTTLSPRWSGGRNRVVFVPSRPLNPQSTYRAVFSTGQTLLDGSEGPVPAGATWEFTTGTAHSEPLALDGELQVSLEAGLDPTYTCTDTSCGPLCNESGKVSVTKARVKLPRLSGGVPGRFFGTVALTSDTPYDFTPPSKGSPEPESPVVSLQQPVEYVNGEAMSALITLPSEDAPYTPCFALQVSDDRGNSVVAKSLCLDDTFPSTMNAGAGGGSGAAGHSGLGNDGTPTAGHYPDLVDDTVKPKTSSSCSFTHSPRGSLWPLALAALLFSRRRRSKTAP